MSVCQRQNKLLALKCRPHFLAIMLQPAAKHRLSRHFWRTQAPVPMSLSKTARSGQPTQLNVIHCLARIVLATQAVTSMILPPVLVLTPIYQSSPQALGCCSSSFFPWPDCLDKNNLPMQGWTVLHLACKFVDKAFDMEEYWADYLKPLLRCTVRVSYTDSEARHTVATKPCLPGP